MLWRKLLDLLTLYTVLAGPDVSLETKVGDHEGITDEIIHFRPVLSQERAAKSNVCVMVLDRNPENSCLIAARTSQNLGCKGQNTY